MNQTQEAVLRKALSDICAARLCEINSMSSRGEMLRLMDEVATALRAVLIKPEPRNQCGETCERAKLCAVCARGLAEPQEPVAWRYWSTKWHSWEYSDAPPVFPAVPAGTKVEPLYTAAPRKSGPSGPG